MKNGFKYIGAIICTTCQFIMILSCNNKRTEKKEDAAPVRSLPAAQTSLKPPGTYPDTLTINYPAAVFYYPDSIQLTRIKAASDPMSYESSMHEYFYQVRNAHMVIKKTWPWLRIVESKKYRVLLFITKNNTREYIDLDTKSDTHGLFVFNREKPPRLVDMTNLETAISFYLEKP